MSITTFRVNHVSPVARAQAEAVIRPLVAQRTNTNPEHAHNSWRAIYPDIGQAIAGNQPPVFNLGDEEWTEKLIDRLAKPVFTVDTSNWRGNRAAVRGWITDSWRKLALPGDPPDEMLLRANWSRAGVRRSHVDRGIVRLANDSYYGTQWALARHVSALPYGRFE